jgi:hypothetical protein
MHASMHTHPCTYIHACMGRVMMRRAGAKKTKNKKKTESKIN